uniref:ORF53a n=1 Tax=Pinus koraiensis TaxID=88728 RepID=Q85WS2_PINKO|nr:ORF53a [Pinus koraiensis]AAO74147.1 ORF53a [Pinus koraiensis]
MVFVNLFPVLFFMETILSPVLLFLPLQLSDCTSIQSGKQLPSMNGYTTGVLTS